VKTTELIEALSTPPPEEVCAMEIEVVDDTEDDDIPYDDVDFWEAIDILETCRKTFKVLLRNGDGMSPARRRLVENLRDDIGQFVGTFLELPEENS
jgi:hypothetical protein